jgi:hypothetical protein
MPVENLLRHITELIHQDAAKAKIIAGTRLLHQAHFEFRGSSERPEGLPERATRLSDSGLTATDLETTSEGRQERPGTKRGREP